MNIQWKGRAAGARAQTIRAIGSAAGIAVALSASLPAHAADLTAGFADPAVHVAFGRDPSHGINKYEVGVNFNSGFQWGNPDGWLTKVQWEFNLAHWDARSGTHTNDVFEFGFTPFFRLEKHGSAWVPFIEAGIGPHVLSGTYTSDQHHFSTAFQFSDVIGVGVGFGPKQAAEAGFRFQHLSNAGIKGPNPGSNFYTGYVRYRF